MPDRLLVAIASPDGAIHGLNPHCEDATGFALAAVRGQPLWQRLPAPEYAEVMRCGFLKAAAGESQQDLQGNWQARDGGRFAVLWGYSGLRDANGEMQAVVVTGFDMRAARQLQASLAEALDHYQTILDDAMDGIVTLAEDASILSFNPAAERIFGYRAGEVLGRLVTMLMPQSPLPVKDATAGEDRPARQPLRIGPHREITGLRRDGTVVPIELSLGSVVIGGRRLFTAVIRDISDRRRLEQALAARRRFELLARLERRRSLLRRADGLALEISQPLTAIVSYSQACLRLIAAGTADRAELEDTLGRIAKQGVRAASVIRRLCDDIEGGKFEEEAAAGEDYSLESHLRAVRP